MLQQLVMLSASLAFVAAPSSTQSGQYAAPVRGGEVLIIGELHGTQEVPAYVGRLVQTEARRHAVVFGVEQREDTRHLPCSAAGSYPNSWQSPLQDGRTSTAMHDMLCKVSRLRTVYPIRIVYLDEPAPSFSSLDQASARKFAAAFTDPGALGIILIGNYHSRNSPASIAGFLRSVGLTVVSATTSTAASNATAWQCRSSGCAIQTGAADLCNHRSSNPQWIKSPDPRWDYCLVLPTFTASPPATAKP